jgi:hypothetical protein
MKCANSASDPFGVKFLPPIKGAEYQIVAGAVMQLAEYPICGATGPGIDVPEVNCFFTSFACRVRYGV